jgi:uncharacterized membrane protein
MFPCGWKMLVKAIRDIHRPMSLLSEWFKNQISKTRKLEIWDWLAIALIVAYGLVFSYFTILKHNLFQSYAWDLGIFDQAMYTTLHGQLLHHTADSFLNLSGSFFAQHISPILLVILPFYALQPSATTLLVIKSFGLALGGLPLYFISRAEFNSKKIGVMLVALYLLYPALQASNWFDFQPQVFLPLFILSSHYFFKTEKWKRYFLSIVLALMVEEHISIIVFVLAAFMFINDWKTFLPSLKNRKINKAVISVTTMIICIAWFISAFYIKGTFPINAQFIVRYQASETYSVLGLKGDPLTLPLQVLTNPQRVWDALMYDYVIKFFYVVILFAPLLFLPFKDRLVIGVFALLAPFLLSNYWAFYTIGAHYPLYILPVIFIATVMGLKKLHPSAQMTTLKTALMVTVLFIASTSPISPISAPFGAAKDRIFWYPDMSFTPTEHTATLNNLVQLIPSNASILTQNHLFPHLSARSNAYVIPPIGRFENDTEYVKGLMDKSDYVLLDLWGWDPLTAMVYDLASKNASYGFYALGVKSFLLKRGYNGAPLYKEYTENRVYAANEGLIISSYATLTTDPSVEAGKSILCPQGTKGIITFGPYAYLLPGTYQVTFAIRAAEHTDGYIGTVDVSDDFGSSVLSKRDIYGFELQPDKWKNFTLTFTSTELRRSIEYRTFSGGSTNMYVHKVYVRRISSVAAYDFGSETLAPGSIYLTPGQHLRTDTGNDTEEGFFVHYHNSTGDVFWYGPYWSLAQGNYTVTFFLKITPPPQVQNKKVIDLQISVDAATKSIAEHEVYSSSFSGKDGSSTWHAFKIEFESKTPLKQVEFRGLKPSADYDIYLAYVLVERAN